MPRRPLPIFLCLLFILPLSAPAQQREGILRYSNLQRKGLTAGASHATLSFRTGQGAADIDFVETDFTMPSVAAEFVVPLDGPNTAASLERLGESVDALAAMAIDLEAATGEDPHLRGMRLIEGRLYSWPPENRPHLLFQPEGTFSIESMESGPAFVHFDDGTSVTLHSINGPLPQVRGSVSVYTGALRDDKPPAAYWPDDVVLAVLEPLRRGADPHELFVSNSAGEERAFRKIRLLPLERLDTDRGDVVLAFRPPLPASVREAFDAGRRITVDVDLPSSQWIAQAIVPAGRILARRGSLMEGRELPGEVRNALALDPAGRRLAMLTVSRGRGRGGGVPPGQLFDYLSREGYTELLDLGERLSLLIPNMEEARRYREAANVSTRLALTIQERTQTIEIPDVDGELYRIQSLVLEGTRREFPANTAGRLTDGRLSFSHELNTFWAASMDEKGRARALRLVLPRPMPLAAIELVHVEAAGFSPEFNLKGFRLTGRRERGDAWRELLRIDHEEPVARERLVVPGAPVVSEVRLEITEPNFFRGGKTSRLAEIFLWSTEPEVQ